MSDLTRSISPRGLKRLWDQERHPVLLDVRSPTEFRERHVPGAVSLPLDQLDPEQALADLDRPGLGITEPLYVTCLSGVRAQQAAARLVAAGYPNVVLLEGGTRAWEAAGLALRRGRRALSLEQQMQLALGAVLVLKVVLGFAVHPLFFVVIGILGAAMIAAAAGRGCPLTELLARMPWNERGKPGGAHAQGARA